jgi:hypothetical protein
MLSNPPSIQYHISPEISSLSYLCQSRSSANRVISHRVVNDRGRTPLHKLKIFDEVYQLSTTWSIVWQWLPRSTINKFLSRGSWVDSKWPSNFITHRSCRACLISLCRRKVHHARLSYHSIQGRLCTIMFNSRAGS